MTSRSPRSLAGRAVGAARGAVALAGWTLQPTGASVLTYHDVMDDHVGSTDQITRTVLRDQLSDAMRLGIDFVSLPTLVERLLTGESIERLAAVAFDDALVGVHRYAVDVLSDLGVPATVFAVSSRLGMPSPVWDRDLERVMTPAELREVADVGFDVQSHTRTHADLPMLDRGALEDELVGARKELGDLLGRKVEYLAYPFGHYDAHVRTAVRDAGYRAAFTFRNGRITSDLDPFQLPRLPMWTSPGRFRLAYTLARPAWSFPEHQVGAVTGD